MYLRLCLPLFLLSCGINLAAGQASAPTDARQEFESVFSDWKSLLGEMRMMRARAQNAEDSELPAMVTEYDRLILKGEQMIPQLRDAAIAVYREDPNSDRQITNWLSTIAADYVEDDRFNDAWPALEALVDGNTDDATVYNNAGIVAFVQHRFEEAKAYFERAAAAGVLTSQSRIMFSAVDKYIQYWAREQRLRKEADELTGDDRLPRVKMETNRGTIIFELFEDEAPETVGNFIHLVSQGFYDGLVFHRVIGGFMAQGGGPNPDGTGGPGYEIYCECFKPDHRQHFTGSLSMAHREKRDTGGSQFFITFVPTPQLNGEHTVFGRVIEGMDVLPKIKRRNPQNPADLALTPDKIIKAEVIHKRDHEYKPNKVK